ncbi:MAG: glycosyl hydrolase [Oscillospiraceae bacterium]|nr:glycosyl hydrolase [Oscillospiraceae bacterium]
MTDFEKALQNPPKKYRPVPFWSWNEKLDVEETKKQIRQMNEAGLGGFFMHARGGLQTEYLSEEWFDNVSASLDEGKKLGMLAWGYDENGWPSGFGNGAVNGLGLKYQQKYLRCVETSTPTEDEFTLSNVQIGDKTYHCYFDVNPFYVDTMNGEVIGEFLKSTHEKYREKLGGDFKKMKGFFTDEPQASRNGIPWSFNLEREYERIYGEQIREHLPKLFYRIDGYEEFRFRYWQLVRDLFTDSFMGTIGKWCKENGSELTGHMVLEEDYYEHILANGCCMPSYEFMDIPGMDHLCRGMPSVQAEMQLTSACNQLGKKQILSETFAGCGWNVSFEDLRQLYEHQMVHGVNLLCQHLEGYSLRGIRKRDYPASLFRHQPWWNDYKIFNDMVSRIGYLLAEGEVEFNILVLHTIESGWLLTDNRNETDDYAKKLTAVMNALEDAQLHYHLGESRIIKRHGSIKNGRFNIGTQSYSVVVVPPALCLDENTFDMLCKFKNQGGTVIFTEEIPKYLNGVKSEKVIDFASKCIITNSAHIAENIPESCRLISLEIEDKLQKEFIRTTVRQFNDRRMTMYYLCNFSDKDNNVTVNVKGKSAKIFDALSGKTMPVCFENCGDNLKIQRKIHSNSSVILFVYEGKENISLKPELLKNTTYINDKLKGKWQISNKDSNSLTLDFCNLIVNGEMIGENIPISDVQEMLCDYRKAVNAKIIFHINIKELSFNTCELMLETPEIFDIFVNNSKVEKIITGYKHDICFKTIDIYKYLKEGENEICLSCNFEQSKATYKFLDNLKYFESTKNRLTYDMEIEAVYLKGDFGVFADNEFEYIERNAVKTKGGFYLSKAPKAVCDGALETQGFPFFAGSITISKKIVLSADEAKNAVIEFSKLPSIVTEVSVNGINAGKIMWKPYSVDISEFAREGENEIKITLAGSLRNLLGPFHLVEGETPKALPFYFFKKTSIWGWGDGTNRNWTEDYSFVQNGLFFK